MIARQVGISPQYGWQIANGIRRPSWDVAKKLVQLTGTPMQIWMEGKKEDRKKAITNWGDQVRKEKMEEPNA